MTTKICRNCGKKWEDDTDSTNNSDDQPISSLCVTCFESGIRDQFSNLLIT